MANRGRFGGFNFAKGGQLSSTPAGFSQSSSRGSASSSASGGTNFERYSYDSGPLPRGKTAYSSNKAIDSVAFLQYGMIGKKRHIDDDDPLEHDDEDDEPAYQPAPGSPGPQANNQEDDDEDEDDPLDNFMAGIEVQARKDKEQAEKREKETPAATSGADKKKQLGRTDIEEADMQESYFTWLEENKPRPDDDEDDEIEYDHEGNPIRVKKMIDPLPPVDHSQIDYQPFEKNFYEEHKEIAELNTAQVKDLSTKLGIKVTGFHPEKPVSSFAHFGFDKELMSVIRRSDYTQPTPIQAQAIPNALRGRDMIGIAKTGSGKTAAYLWPALVHIMDQRELLNGEGAIVLIIVPTRELAIQVHNEARKFGKLYNIRSVCAYGGGSKWEQSKALQDGAEIVVATPGRLIDLVKIEATNLERVTYLVFDEADRMFDLGFEPQVRSIANHVRPDRQTLMFSATFKKKVERLARDILRDPVRILQGEVGEANEDIEQTVQVLPSEVSKLTWLNRYLVEFCSKGKVLIFVTKKQNCEELANSLRAKDFNVGLLHGDMLQHERNEVIHSFRKETLPILVATDVAARGLDIPSIRTVVNYDVARDIDTHVHRVGRTGRAGEKGWAYTLCTEKDKEFAGHLVRNLESVNQTVPSLLMELAMKSSWFRSSRFKKGTAKKMGGRGLGYKEPKAIECSTGASTSAESESSAFLSPNTVHRSFGSKGPPEQPSSGSGRPMDRLSAMKAAFSAQYRTKFQASCDPNSEYDKQSFPITDPTPDWKKELQAQQSDSSKKKRSRWD